MGPGLNLRQKQDATLAPDPHKDAEINRLREELALCDMKIAQFQARLLSTLDELDAQRHSHQSELKAERRVKEKLSSKLDSYLDEVKRAERERDEMRELVSILLEKVEQCNDYSVWPCPRLVLAHPLAPLHDPQLVASKPGTGGEDKAAYHSAIVALLQKQLADEKRAHLLTKERADAEILRLQAMVARRDAELEACATHGGHRLLLSSSAPTDAKPLRPCTRPSCVHGRQHRDPDDGFAPCPHHAPILGSEADSRVLARTMSRNRVLEREIEALRDSVHQARQSQSPSEPKRTTSNGDSPTPPGRRHVSVQVQAGEPMHRSDVGNTPPSPGLPPHILPSSPSPWFLTPRHQRSRTPGLANPPILRASSGTEYGVSTPTAVIQDLKQDIDYLSAEIDGFVVERGALRAVLARDLPEGLLAATRGDLKGRAPSKPNAGHHHEEECARERQALREQLDALARERALREEELRAEIASLKQALNRRRDHPARPPPQEEGDGSKSARASRSGDLRALSVPSPRVSPTLVQYDARLLPTEKRADTPPRADDAGETRGGAGNEGQHQRVTSPEFAGGADEFGEQPMELATPLQTTILSLREDDWPLPPTYLPAAPPAHPHPDVEPADIPLPTSPDTQDPAPQAAAPCIPHSPRPSESPPPQLSTSSSPPLYIAPPRVSSDLLARIESAAHARVTSIEHEIAATRRELEDKEAALAVLDSQLAPSHIQASGGRATDMQTGGADAVPDDDEAADSGLR